MQLKMVCCILTLKDKKNPIFLYISDFINFIYDESFCFWNIFYRWKAYKQPDVISFCLKKKLTRAKFFRYTEKNVNSHLSFPKV